jgi:Family of unknown function (DUF5993)
MEFFAIFLIFAASLWVAWQRQGRKAILLYGVGMALTVAVYLHHATETLPVSF